MIQLRIKNMTVDLAAGSPLSLEYNSPLWFGGDIDFIPGTIVFNFTALATSHNRNIFNFVDSQDSRLTQREYAAKLFFKGSPMIVGNVTVEEIIGGQFTIKLASNVGALSILKTTYLNNLPSAWDKSYSFTGATEMDAAKDGEEDYIFVPFLLEDNTVVNEYHFTNGNFKATADNVPFIQCVALIERLLEKSGWSFGWSRIEYWRTVLFLQGNRDVNTSPFTLEGICPQITASELIKAVAKITGSSIIADSQRRHLKFVPYEYLAKAAIEDWSDKKVGDIAQEFTTATLSDADFSDYRQTDSSYAATENDPVPPNPPINSTLYVPKVDYDLRTTSADNITKPYFVLYRGLEDGSTVGWSYPYASAQAVGSHDFSLDYDGADGINELYEDYINKIGSTRTVTMPLRLSFLDLQKLDFTKKVSIFNAKEGHNINYLIKKIKVSLTNKQITTSTVELIQF